MKTCRLDFCDKPAAKRKTLCGGHTKRKAEGRPLDTPIRPMRSTRPGQDVLAVLREGSLNGGVAYACWVWQGYTRPDKGKFVSESRNYGRASINGRNTYVHRHAYEAAHGPVPDGLEIRHLCNRANCCNPSHLVAGTHQQNMDDCVNAGRARGRNSKA